jgi:hypothetical protein
MGHGVNGLCGQTAPLHVEMDSKAENENALGLPVVGHVMVKVLKQEHVHQVAVQ